ncbi:acetyl-CoA carboxylase biotin carboxyl carrier protein [Lacticaseibacillus jixiensis]|uniref:acetyl-CoA carboxylase biotin carboxyl carrier protein n=1 Tax=Lacticaseibacillus jixiensis TaxID=3231926 RepID=UPI0036F38FE4
MDEATIATLIDKLEASQISELDYTNGAVHLHLTKSPQATSAPAAPKPAQAAQQPSIDAPLVGIVYLAPKPDEPVYKAVGDHVSAGEVVCVIESMKMLNEVKSPISGVIKECLVADAALVEYHQPLFIVEEEADA